MLKILLKTVYEIQQISRFPVRPVYLDLWPGSMSSGEGKGKDFSK